MVATDPAPSTVNVTTSVAVPAQEEIVKRTTHRVNCHCGAVKFLMTLEEPFPAYKINRCSCTVCTKNGYELVYPLRQNVKFVSGFDNLSVYTFGKGIVDHKFCKTCGSSMFLDFIRHSDGSSAKNTFGVNARMIDDVDFSIMEWKSFDGKKLLTPPYKSGWE